GPGVVSQKSEPGRMPATNIDVSGVVPALGRVLEEVDGTDRERGTQNGNVARQHRSGQETKSLEWPPRTDGTATSCPVLDQMSSLQVKAMDAEISDFQRGLLAEALFHRSTPLLDILGRRVELDRGEADRCSAQYGLAKVEPGSDEGCGRRKVVGLLGFGEDI